MVIKGGARSSPGELALHLLRADTNEFVEVRALNAVTARELREALFEMSAMGAGSRSRRPLYHASINTPVWEALTDEQKTVAIDRLETQLGLAGQPRAVVEHVKEGRQHVHVVWLRIDPETGTAIPDSHNYRKHEEVARALEREFGHGRVQGAHHERDGVERPARRPSLAETRQAERSSVTPEDAKARLRELWSMADTGHAFAAALDDAGWILARGDKRGFVALDPMGEARAVNKDITGLSAARVRERLADIDPDTLPSVEEARTEQRARQPSPGRDQARKTAAPTPSEPPREAGQDQATEPVRAPANEAPLEVLRVPLTEAVTDPLPGRSVPPAVTYGYSVRLEGNPSTSWQAPALKVADVRARAAQPERPVSGNTRGAAASPEATQRPSHEAVTPAGEAKRAEIGRLAAVVAAARERLAVLAGRLDAAMDRHRERAREAEHQAQPPASFVTAVRRGLSRLWGQESQQAPAPRSEPSQPPPRPAVDHEPRAVPIYRPAEAVKKVEARDNPGQAVTPAAAHPIPGPGPVKPPPAQALRKTLSQYRRDTGPDMDREL